MVIDVTRLNLLSADEDRELEAVGEVIETYETASNEDEMIAKLRDRAKRGEHFDILDMIGHSSSSGFLVLGTWVIDDRQQIAATFQLLVRPWLERLGIRTIRLLGCSTATSDRARRAIQAIARASGCDVLGTTRYVSKCDYAPGGFISDHILAA